MTANWPIPTIAENCRVRHVWRNLLEQFQPLSAQVVFKHHKAGGVGARPRQAFDEARPHRVGSDDKHDGNGAGDFQHRLCGGAAPGHKHVRSKRNEFRCILS
jgi:hypothetical protein